MPPTGAVIGTPASINARVLAQVDAIEVLPLARTSPHDHADCIGEDILAGITGSNASLCQGP